MIKLFTGSSAFIFDGNAIPISHLKNFFEKELPATKHVLRTIDAQPILKEQNDETKKVLINVSGTVEFIGSETRKSDFVQTLMLQCIDFKWKVRVSNIRLFGTVKIPPKKAGTTMPLKIVAVHSGNNQIQENTPTIIEDISIKREPSIELDD